MEFAKKFMTEKAEKLNGKAAMLGMFALIGDTILLDKLFQVFSKEKLIKTFLGGWEFSTPFFI